MSADLIARGLGAKALARSAVALGNQVIYNRAGLACWHAALANRATAPAKVAWFGDSITEGVLIATSGARWVDRALARLRADYPVAGVTGGPNYLPMWSPAAAAGGIPQPYTSLTGAALVTDSGWGPGGRTALLNASGDGATFTFTCTSVTIHSIKGPASGTLSVTIDGGAATTFATLGSYTGDWQGWSSGALTPGSHTVMVKSAGGGTCYVTGLSVFNGDEAAGVQSYEAGHYGWQSSNFAGAAAGSVLWQWLASALPHLVTIALGTNDYLSQVAPATFKANLQSMIASIRARAPAASIALIMYSRRGDIAAQPIGWDQYVRACYELADADVGGINGASGVAVIDLSPRLPNAATSGTVDALGVYAADRVHYSAKGHALIGEAVAAALGM